MDFRRRLYKRGSSFETTIPMPLLLTLDTAGLHDVIFSYDAEKQAWYISFTGRQDGSTVTGHEATTPVPETLPVGAQSRKHPHSRSGKRSRKETPDETPDKEASS